MITADQLKDVMERADALHRYLNIDQKQVEFEEEQLRTQAPDFWEDPKYAQEQMKKEGYTEVDRRLQDRAPVCRRVAVGFRLLQRRNGDRGRGRRRLR